MGTVYVHDRILGPGIVPADGARVNLTNWAFPANQEQPCEEWNEQVFSDLGIVFPTRLPTAIPTLWEARPGVGTIGPELVAPGFFANYSPDGAGRARRIRDTGDCGGGVAPVTAISGCYRVQWRLQSNDNGVNNGNLSAVSIGVSLSAWELGTSSTFTRYYVFQVAGAKDPGSTVTRFGIGGPALTDEFVIRRKASGGADTVVATQQNTTELPVGTLMGLEVRTDAGLTQAQVRGLINGSEVISFLDNNIGGSDPLPGSIGVGTSGSITGSGRPQLDFKDLEVFPLDLLP